MLETATSGFDVLGVETVIRNKQRKMVTISRKPYRELRKYAVLQHKKMHEMIQEAIDWFIEKHKSQDDENTGKQ